MALHSQREQDEVPFLTRHTSTPYMILPLVALDDKPPIERKLKPKMTLEYRVELTTIGNQIARYDYTMRGTVGPEQGTKEYNVTFVLEDMKGEIAGGATSSARFGSVQVALGPTGFPKNLSFLGNALSFSMPLLSFYLPEKAGAEVEFISPAYDQRITVVGKAWAKGVRIESQANLVVSGEEPDRSTLRRLKMKAEFDKSGTLLSSSGKYTAPDGTVNFKVTKK